MSDQSQARLRAELILKVRAGVITASEAAKQLGVSRKTYYKWEKRGLAAMLEGLYEHNSGRPATEVDEEKEVLKNRLQELQEQVKVLEQTMRIREVLWGKETPETEPSGQRQSKRKRLSQSELDLNPPQKFENPEASKYRARPDRASEGRSAESSSGTGGPNGPPVPESAAGQNEPWSVREPEGDAEKK